MDGGAEKEGAGRSIAVGPGGLKAVSTDHSATRAGAREPSLHDAALALAGRGFHVFPVNERTGRPRIKGWGVEASVDAAQIAAWWTTWPTANIAVACGPSGLCVVDLDVKKGKDGPGTLRDLELDHGRLPPTLRAHTPSGGQHLYFRGEAATTVEALGPGVDTRSAGGQGGYVIAAPSRTERGAYSWANGAPVAELPTWVRELAGKPRERKDRDAAPAVELDTPEALAWAADHLSKHAAPARAEGYGSDSQTFALACVLRDRGVSEERAVELMNSEWRHPHDPGWVETKVRNAYAYAADRAGCDTPGADFADEPPALAHGGAAPPRAPTRFRFLSFDELLSMEPPEWLVGGLVPLGSVGVVYGPSGALKSFLALHLAACCAVGREAFPGRPCREADAFYVAAEGASGFRLRAAAWARHHGARPERLRVLAGSVLLDRPGEAEALADAINALAAPGSHRVVVVDTLSANSSGKENTDDMAAFMRRCFELARRAGATVIVLHHTGKDREREERGHYSIRANADFSIRVDRTRTGAVVEAQKLRDAPTGAALRLRAVEVEVAPGAEFHSSLVLVEEDAADDFDDPDTALVRETAAGMDGGSEQELAEALVKATAARRDGKPFSMSTARRRIGAAIGVGREEAVEHDGGKLWREPHPTNERGGKTIRFEGPSPDPDFTRGEI